MRPRARFAPTSTSSTRWSAGRPPPRSAMLEVDRIDVHLQGSHILRDVSLAVGPREVVCLVGRNGAGKTTALRTIMGLLRPTRGRIAFRDRDIHRLPTHEIARLG